jgi:hypothetical protein
VHGFSVVKNQKEIMQMTNQSREEQDSPEEYFNLTTLADNWSSDLISRDQQQLDSFSGGILNARTLANVDSLGTGPKGRVKIGRKVAYPVHSLVEWMQAKREM